MTRLTDAQAARLADHPPRYRPFWEHLAAGEIAFPHCTACGAAHWYPMTRCPHCLAQTFDWTPVDGRGRLYAWTVVRRPFSPEFADRLPYIVGLVEFAETPGIRLITTIVDSAPDRLTIDAPVAPVVVNDAQTLPTVNFRPIRETT